MELRIRNLSKSYGDVQALKGVSLAIGPGIFGLLGPNGAGKSSEAIIERGGGARPRAGRSCERGRHSVVSQLDFLREKKNENAAAARMPINAPAQSGPSRTFSASTLQVPATQAAPSDLSTALRVSIFR
jgi:ABC-type branched-subunit amino acid transport system ATPase component